MPTTMRNRLAALYSGDESPGKAYYAGMMGASVPTEMAYKNALALKAEQESEILKRKNTLAGRLQGMDLSNITPENIQPVAQAAILQDDAGKVLDYFSKMSKTDQDKLKEYSDFIPSALGMMTGPGQLGSLKSMIEKRFGPELAKNVPNESDFMNSDGTVNQQKWTQWYRFNLNAGKSLSLLQEELKQKEMTERTREGIKADLAIQSSKDANVKLQTTGKPQDYLGEDGLWRSIRVAADGRVIETIHPKGTVPKDIVKKGMTPGKQPESGGNSGLGRPGSGGTFKKGTYKTADGKLVYITSQEEYDKLLGK